MENNSSGFRNWLKKEDINFNLCSIKERGLLERIYHRSQQNIELTNKQSQVLKIVKKKKPAKLKTVDTNQRSLIIPLKKLNELKTKYKDGNRYLWMELNGEKLHYYKIENHLCFLLDEVGGFIKKPCDIMKATFNRISKKFFKEVNDDFFIDGTDFLQCAKIDFSLNNDLSLNKRNNQNFVIFLTFLGLWKILATFRDDYTTWIYHKMSEHEYNRMRYKKHGKAELSFNVGSELRELYKKYNIFLETLKQIKSPIERWFYTWAWDKINGLERQYPVSNLHVDFAIPELKIAIECDGKMTHTTVEDRNRDNKRDAFLNSQGWQVQRFTGNQIYNDVEDCVNRVLKIIENKKIGNAYAKKS